MFRYFVCIEKVHDRMTAMDNKTQIDAILLDFAEAFDKDVRKRILSTGSLVKHIIRTHICYQIVGIEYRLTHILLTFLFCSF